MLLLLRQSQPQNHLPKMNLKRNQIPKKVNTGHCIAEMIEDLVEIAEEVVETIANDHQFDVHQHVQVIIAQGVDQVETTEGHLKKNLMTRKHLQRKIQIKPSMRKKMMPSKKQTPQRKKKKRLL